jgi:hypothetical protein
MVDKIITIRPNHMIFGERTPVMNKILPGGGVA